MLFKSFRDRLVTRRFARRVVAGLWVVLCLASSGLSAQPLSPPTNLRVILGALPPGGLPPGMTLRDIDGGADYFSLWPNTLPTSASFFPIGGWLESVIEHRYIDLDREAGLNTYVAITRNSNLDLVYELTYRVGGEDLSRAAGRSQALVSRCECALRVGALPQSHIAIW